MPWRGRVSPHSASEIWLGSQFFRLSRWKDILGRGDRKGLRVFEEAVKFKVALANGAFGGLLLLSKHGGYGASVLTWLIYKHICTESLPHASHSHRA